MREEGMEREGERGEKAGRLRGREIFDVQSWSDTHHVVFCSPTVHNSLIESQLETRLLWDHDKWDKARPFHNSNKHKKDKDFCTIHKMSNISPPAKWITSLPSYRVVLACNL